MPPCPTGHASKPLHLHQNWTHRVTEEFYRQGDDEKKALVPVSPFMDRGQADLPKAQVGFMNFLVRFSCTIAFSTCTRGLATHPLRGQVIPMYKQFLQTIDPQEKLPCLRHLNGPFFCFLRALPRCTFSFAHANPTLREL
jgi:hypothetical protein